MLRCRLRARLCSPFLALVLALSTLVAGALPALAQATPPGQAAAAAAAAWPMTVTDDAGRTVTIPAMPRRILSMAPSLTEILFAVGVGDRVVGVDTFSDYPEAANSLPRIGDLFNPSHERMLMLQPDLVLAIDGSEKMWGKLADYGVPVLVIQPAGLVDVLDAILLVGRVTGARAAADELVASMRARMDEIRRRLKPVTSRPRVFWEIWHDPLMSVGPGSFMHDMLEFVGAENIAADTGQAWPSVSAEAMIGRNPEVIITSDPEWARRVIAGELPAWRTTVAGRWERVVYIDPNLTSRPGPRIVDGLDMVSRAVHPWVFWYWWWF